MIDGGRSQRLFIPYGFLLLSFFIQFCSHLCIETRPDLVSNQYLSLFIISDLSNSPGSHSVSNVYKYIYTKILEVTLFAFAYRLFHGDFSPYAKNIYDMHQ